MHIESAETVLLTEQVAFTTRARATTLVPWVKHPAGFALTGWPWSDEDAAREANRVQPPCEYVVITHLTALAEPWTVNLRLVRTSDARCLGTLDASFLSTSSGDAIRTLARQMVALLGERSGLQPATASGYELPRPGFVPQLPGSPGAAAGPALPIHGRQSFRWADEHARDHRRKHPAVPGQPPKLYDRMLLVQTLEWMSAIRPDIVRESADRVARLQSEHPLPGELHSLVQKDLRRIFPDDTSVPARQ